MFRSRKYLWLFAIIGAGALLFLWKCHHFFNGDGLFFFSHQVGSWADIWRFFKGPDHLWQYRPLTFVIFSFFLKPLFGLDPLGYNIFPLLVHAGNTLILFGILRMLAATASAVAETSLLDLKRQRPTLPDGARLYIVDKSSLGGLQWYYDYGSLIRLFYPAKALDIQFASQDRTLPQRREIPHGANTREYDGSHLSVVPE
jgi:hypothetical protein